MDREKVMTWLEICGKNNDCSGCCPYSENGFGEYGRCRESLMADAYDLLKEQEAKTGKWIEQTDCLGDTYYDCSVCNESWITIEGTPWVNGMNYCPHCGAKMEFEGR